MQLKTNLVLAAGSNTNAAGIRFAAPPASTSTISIVKLVSRLVEHRVDRC